MSPTNLTLGTSLTQLFWDTSWMPPRRKEKKQIGQFLCADALPYFFSEKLLKYFPELQNILEAKDSPGRKADI